MVVTLERREREAAGHLVRQLGKLLEHELIGEVVRLGCDADRDLVALGGLDERHEVRHRLSDARPRLDRTVGRGAQRVGDLARHRDLLRARLVVPVHGVDDPALIEGATNLPLRRDVQRREVERVFALPVAAHVEQLRAFGHQRERCHRDRLREVREYGPVRPCDIGVHVSEVLQQSRRKIREGGEQDAPHARQRVHVVAGAMGHRGAPERLRYERELVRGEAREGNAREGQGVDPQLAHQGSSRYALHERPVERRVVRDDRRAVHELSELGNGLDGARGVGHLRVGDVRERDDLLGYRSRRVDERVEALRDLSCADAGRADLYELVLLRGEAGRLGIEDDDLALYESKIALSRAFGEGLVAPRDLLGRSGEQTVPKGGLAFLLSIHHRSDSSASSIRREHTSLKSMPA